MNITVKNVPDSIYRVMKREAKRKGGVEKVPILQALQPSGSDESLVDAANQLILFEF